MTFPDNLKYSKDHEWIRFEDNFGYIGITEFAQRELGDIVFVDVLSYPNFYKQGEVFGVVEAVKTVSDLFMPISGTIVEVNPIVIENNPELVNSDPYGDGWIIKVEIDNLDENEWDHILGAEEYKKLIGE